MVNITMLSGACRFHLQIPVNNLVQQEISQLSGIEDFFNIINFADVTKFTYSTVHTQLKIKLIVTFVLRQRLYITEHPENRLAMHTWSGFTT